MIVFINFRGTCLPAFSAHCCQMCLRRTEALGRWEAISLNNVCVCARWYLHTCSFFVSNEYDWVDSSKDLVKHMRFLMLCIYSFVRYARPSLFYAECARAPCTGTLRRNTQNWLNSTWLKIPFLNVCSWARCSLFGWINGRGRRVQCTAQWKYNANERISRLLLLRARQNKPLHRSSFMSVQNQNTKIKSERNRTECDACPNWTEGWHQGVLWLFYNAIIAIDVRVVRIGRIAANRAATECQICAILRDSSQFCRLAPL